jgi:predicted O-linked N-acetylglucosamine transferase (SPINDLY family)
MTQPLQREFDLANQHRRGGRLREAESIYRQILLRQPNQADALHMLGLVVFDLRRGSESVDLLRRAILASPKRSDFQFNLGFVLSALGRRSDAIDAYRQAISLRSDFPEAYRSLADALLMEGRFAEAIDSYRRALELKPNWPETLNNLAAAVQSSGKLEEALQLFQKLVAMDPNSPTAHLNLGEAFRLLGQTDSALAEFRRAMELGPALPEAPFKIGVVERSRRNLDAAAAAYVKALSLRPNYAEAESNLGNVLKDMGDLPGAIQHYQSAAAQRPDMVDADCNAVLTMHYSDAYDFAALHRELRAWNQRVAVPLRPMRRQHDNDTDPDRRLRVGYVSADFRDHACAFFLDPLLRSHDHSKFEIFFYAQVPSPDARTAQFRKYCDQWQETAGVRDDVIAEQIRRDQIDILIDCKLHTSENRLRVFAYKPAPIQVSWLGYPGSSGLETIDYRLVDRHIEPAGCEYKFDEKPIFLPENFWVYDPLASELVVNPLPAQSAGHLIFGCLNNFCKVTDRTIELWTGALKAVPNSRLILLAPLGSARQRVSEKFRAGGIDPSRIEFVDNRPRAEYLATYHRIDICLDTLPYNGHTTSLDSLWMGVPVLTLPGGTPPGRVGVMHLKNLGLTQFIAQNDTDFARIAAQYASDLNALSELRAGLRDRLSKSVLMDGPRFTQNVEKVYRDIWRTWCAGGQSMI